MTPKRITDVNGLMHLYKVENFYFAGQPNSDAIKEMKSRGVKRVINLRSPSEMDFTPEKNLCDELGLEYIELPLLEDGKFNASNVKKLNDLLGNTTEPEFIHCGTANRVAGWAITYLVERKGMDFDDAVDIASEAGLSNFSFADEAKRYLKV